MDKLMGDKRKPVNPKDEAIGRYVVCTPEHSDGSIIFVGRSKTAGYIQRECRIYLKQLRSK